LAAGGEEEEEEEVGWRKIDYKSRHRSLSSAI